MDRARRVRVQGTGQQVGVDRAGRVRDVVNSPFQLGTEQPGRAGLEADAGDMRLGGFTPRDGDIHADDGSPTPRQNLVGGDRGSGVQARYHVIQLIANRSVQLGEGT